MLPWWRTGPFVGFSLCSTRVHLAFEYTGEEDPTRYTREKISEDDLEDQVAALLKNVDWRPCLSGAFRAGRRPREVLLRVVDYSFESSTFVE